MLACLTVLSVWGFFNLSNVLRSLYVLRKWARGTGTIVAIHDRSGGVDGVYVHVKLLTVVHSFKDGERSVRTEPFRPLNAKLGDKMPIRFRLDRPHRFHSENWLRSRIISNVVGMAALALIGALAVILDMIH